MTLKLITILIWAAIGLGMAFLLGHTKIGPSEITILKPFTFWVFILFWVVAFIEETIRLNFWE